MNRGGRWHGLACLVTGGRACRWPWRHQDARVEDAGRPSLHARLSVLDADVHPERYQPPGGGS